MLDNACAGDTFTSAARAAKRECTLGPGSHSSRKCKKCRLHSFRTWRIRLPFLHRHRDYAGRNNASAPSHSREVLVRAGREFHFEHKYRRELGCMEDPGRQGLCTCWHCTKCGRSCKLGNCPTRECNTRLAVRPGARLEAAPMVLVVASGNTVAIGYAALVGAGNPTGGGGAHVLRVRRLRLTTRARWCCPQTGLKKTRRRA